MKGIFRMGLLAVFALGVAGCGRQSGIEASGTVEVREVDIASKLSGRVVRLHADRGDRVTGGQLLAELDERLVTAQYEDAKAFYDQSFEEYKRAKDLYGSSSITRQKYDQSETFYLQAKSRLAQAELAREEAKVKAPWAGVILQKYVEEGELVSSLSPLFTLGDLKTVKLTIYVTLKEMERLTLGDPAEIRIDAFKDRVFPGKVVSISDKAEFTPKNVQTRDERVKEVFAVQIALANDEGILKPGMPADAYIRKEEADGARGGNGG